MMQDETVMWPPRETSKCKKASIILTISVHALDLSLGLFFLITGIPIARDPLFAGVLLSLGPLLIISSVSGIIGFLSTDCRIGITIDIFLALIIAIYELSIVFLSMIFKGNLIQYMKDHASDLNLNNTFIDKFKSDIWVYWIAGIILAIMEFLKFFTLRGVDKYLTEDELMRRYAHEGNQLQEPLRGAEAKEEDVTSLDSDDSDTVGFFASQKKPTNHNFVDADEFSPLTSELHVASLHWSRGLQNNATTEPESVSSSETSISALYDIRWANVDLNGSLQSSYMPPKPDVEHL